MFIYDEHEANEIANSLVKASRAIKAFAKVKNLTQELYRCGNIKHGAKCGLNTNTCTCGLDKLLRLID